MSESALATQQSKVAVAWNEAGAQINSLDEAWRFASIACRSGLVPKALDTPEKCFIAMQCGMELGFAPFSAMQSIHVIEGKPSLPVEVAAGLVESGGFLAPGTKVLFRFEGERGKADWRCIAYSTPRGGKLIESEPVYFRDFGHLHQKDNWKRYPDRMLKARAVGYHVRDFYAGAIRKLPFAEEVMDIEERRGRVERDVTPPGERKVSGALAAKIAAASAPTDEPPACPHPEGFAADSESGERVCVECGEREPVQAELL